MKRWANIHTGCNIYLKARHCNPFIVSRIPVATFEIKYQNNFTTATITFYRTITHFGLRKSFQTVVTVVIKIVVQELINITVNGYL